LKAREAAHSDDTISESWLTGIQEVELPMEYVQHTTGRFPKLI